MPEIENLLIISNSGRMLTQLANNAGFSTVVIDCFADEDTQAFALECIKVETLALEYLATAFYKLEKKYSLIHAIYGSGFEKHPESLDFLHKNLNIIGNTANVFAAIQNKANFFSKLNQLNISFPKVVFQVPDTAENWLVKPMQGEGGFGIKKFTGQVELSDSCYWQKNIAGQSMSVLFLAYGAKCIICGFHKQLAHGNGFIFTGIMSQLELSVEIKKCVSDYVVKLALEFELKGLNSLDFILTNDHCYVLEINPRPSASLQLYDDGLLSAHISCCMQGRCEELPVLKEHRAYKIVFAETDLIINKNIQWPPWLVDRPLAGSIIHTGRPICSIIADGKNEQHVLNKLSLRQKIVTEFLQ